MSDGRQRRRAKQARRDARRMAKRNKRTPDDTTTADIVRRALARKHPLHLLSVACMIIHLANPDPLGFLKSRRRDTLHLDELVTNLIGVRNREATALLAVLAELLVDDPGPQLRCRHELAERDDHLPDGSPPYRSSTRTGRCAEPTSSVMSMSLSSARASKAGTK